MSLDRRGGSNQTRRRSHALHGVERQDSCWSKWYLGSLHLDELALKLWSIIFPCPRQGLNGKDALEILPLSHASGAGFSEPGPVGAGLNWQKHMLTIMDLDQDSYWKWLQEYLRLQAFQHCASSPVLMGLGIIVSELYLQDGGRCVLDCIRLIQRCREAYFHADV